MKELLLRIKNKFRKIMSLKKILFGILGGGMFFSACTLFETRPELKWICYYGSGADVGPFVEAELVVLDANTLVPVRYLRDKDITVLSYVSIGEVNKNRYYFQTAKKMKILLKTNPNWEGSWMVDVRNPQWGEFLVNEYIPKLVKMGFNGLFLDTLDSSMALEMNEPKRYKNMQKALVELIKNIKDKYPDLYIMTNRGIPLAPQYASHVNGILGESLETDYNFEEKKYRLRSKDEAKEYIGILQKVKKQFEIDIYTLDYWDPEDKKTRLLIYKQQMKRGFIPYVATVALDQVIPVD